MKVNLMFSF